MARINAAMAASLAQRNNLFRRDISSEASSVKNSFSSWDNCMQASYCKWPVIAIIIVGALILFSIIWCIVRCACCGLSCCCTCFSCLKCCGDCCGCCSKPGDRKHKHLDEPYSSTPAPAPINQGYQAPPQTMGYTNPAAEPPKFAQFETGKSGFAVDPPKSIVSDDALPPMPSWEGAANKRIMVEEEAHAKEEGVELGHLNHAGQSMPLMNGQSPGVSPMDGYPGMAQGGYMAGAGNSPVDQYGQAQSGNSPVDQYRGQQYGRGQNPQGQYPPNGGYGGRPPPQRQYSGDTNRGGPGGPGGPRGPGGPGGPRPYGPGGPGRLMTNSPGPNGFGPPGRQLTGSPSNYGPGPQRNMNNSPAPNGSPSNYGPGPQRNMNNSPGPQRAMNNSPGPNGFMPPPRSLTGGMPGQGTQGPRPGAQRSYTGDSYRNMPPTSPSSPLNNDAGNFAYSPQQQTYASAAPNFSRPSPPQQQGSFSTSPPSYATRSPPPSLNPGGYRGASPPPQAPARGPSPAQYQAMPVGMSSMSTEERRASGGVAYPGYKPYSPAPQQRAQSPEGLPSALMPGGGH